MGRINARGVRQVNSHLLFPTKALMGLMQYVFWQILWISLVIIRNTLDISCYYKESFGYLLLLKGILWISLNLIIMGNPLDVSNFPLIFSSFH